MSFECVSLDDAVRAAQAEGLTLRQFLDAAMQSWVEVHREDLQTANREATELRRVLSAPR